MGVLIGAVPIESSVSDSIVGGLLTLSVGAGDAEIHVGWTRPTTNTDASFLGDLRSFKIYLGTSSGNYDLINGLDTFTTDQKGATEVVFTGLTDSVTYYVTVAAVDAFVNGSAQATEQSFVAAIPSSPSRSFTDITGTTTISVSGDYRLTASFSGKVTLAVDDIYLFFNGHTITFDTDHGIEITGVRDNIEIDTPTFIATGGAGDNIRVSANLTNSEIHGATFQSRNVNTSGIAFASETTLATGCRFHDLAIDINVGGTSGNSRNAMLIRNGSNYKCYDFEITITNSGRDGGFAEGNNNEVWAGTITATATTGANTLVTCNPGADQSKPVNDWYIHDTIVNLAPATSGRAIHNDGGLRWYVLHNTIKIGASARGIGCRGTGATAADGFVVGYNDIDGGDLGVAAGIRWGGIEFAGVPVSMYGYENPIIGCDGSGFELYEEWSGTLSTWNNPLNGVSNVDGGGDVFGIWNSNDDIISGTVTSSPSMRDWNIFNSFVVGQVSGETDHITFTVSWTGFNGNTDTPSAPTSIVAIT